MCASLGRASADTGPESIPLGEVRMVREDC
jgi:hypothetical protein